MANQRYSHGAEQILAGEIDFADDTIKISIHDGLSFNDSHEDYNDIKASALGDVTLSGKSITNGVFDAADATYTAVPSGDEVTCYVIRKDTGNDATSPLLFFFDTDSNSNPISVPTNGGNITIVFNASGIAAL